MFCWNCGHNLDDDCEFCPNCGLNLASGVLSTNSQTHSSYQYKTNSHSPILIACTIFIIFLGSIFNVGISLRTALTPAKVNEITENLDLEDVISDIIPPKTLSREERKFFNSSVKKILKKSYAKEFIARKISLYVEDLFDKTETAVITADEIIDFIDDNSKNIKKIFKDVFYSNSNNYDGYSDYYDDFFDLDQYLDYVEETLEDTIDIESLSNLTKIRNRNKSLNWIHILFGKFTLIITCLLSIASMILIFYYCRWSIEGCKYLGISMFGIGIETLLSLIILSFIKDSFSIDSNLLDTILSPICKNVATFGVIALIIGIVLFVIYFFKDKSRRLY